MTPQQLSAFVAVATPESVSDEIRDFLRDENLVDETGVQLTERGAAFLWHLLAQPLPEQVMTWRVPGGSSMSAPLPGRETGEGVATPAPPSPTRVSRRPIPTDPSELRAEALRMMDSGYGMNETAEFLKLSPDQVQAIFYGGS